MRIVPIVYALTCGALVSALGAAPADSGAGAPAAEDPYLWL